MIHLEEDEAPNEQVEAESERFSLYTQLVNESDIFAGGRSPGRDPAPQKEVVNIEQTLLR